MQIYIQVKQLGKRKASIEAQKFIIEDPLRNLEAITIFFLKCDLQFPPGTSLCIMQPLRRMPQV